MKRVINDSMILENEGSRLERIVSNGGSRSHRGYFHSEKKGQEE